MSHLTSDVSRPKKEGVAKYKGLGDGTMEEKEEEEGGILATKHTV